jgi:hypothetical protein
VYDGPRGPRSDAAFVEISPPVSVSGQFDDISRIILIADVGPATEQPRCIAGNDGGWVCTLSVKGKMLDVSVHFRSPAAARIDERTKLVAKDVGETENVIKQWYRR